MTLTEIAALIAEIGVLLGAIIPAIIFTKKIVAGMKCQLRDTMLRIYYRNRSVKRIRQYEFENFMLSYDAYVALKGNSFIEKIHEEVCTWEVVT